MEEKVARLLCENASTAEEILVSSICTEEYYV